MSFEAESNPYTIALELSAKLKATSALFWMQMENEIELDSDKLNGFSLLLEGFAKECDRIVEVLGEVCDNEEFDKKLKEYLEKEKKSKLCELATSLE